MCVSVCHRMTKLTHKVNSHRCPAPFCCSSSCWCGQSSPRRPWAWCPQGSGIWHHQTPAGQRSVGVKSKIGNIDKINSSSFSSSYPLPPPPPPPTHTQLLSLTFPPSLLLSLPPSLPLSLSLSLFLPPSSLPYSLMTWRPAVQPVLFPLSDSQWTTVV